MMWIFNDARGLMLLCGMAWGSGSYWGRSFLQDGHLFVRGLIAFVCAILVAAHNRNTP